MVIYSCYCNPIKLQTEVMGIPEAVEKFFDNILLSVMVESLELIKILI